MLVNALDIHVKAGRAPKVHVRLSKSDMSVYYCHVNIVAQGGGSGSQQAHGRAAARAIGAEHV